MLLELVVLFVIQDRPCLYDKSDVGFENSTAREIAYNEAKDILKKRFYTIPHLFTTEFLDKFINEILIKAPNQNAAFEIAREKFKDVDTQFVSDLENVMAEYPNLWDKSNPNYNNTDVRKKSFMEIAKASTKNHHFIKTFIDQDFVEQAWKTKVKIIEESSLC